MIDSPEATVSAVFHALADPHRRRILHDLERGPHAVGELAARLPISLAAASKHVQVLERSGLLRKSIEGRRHVCHLEGAALATAHAWIARYERFWSDHLDELDRRLRRDDASQPHTTGGDEHA